MKEEKLEELFQSNLELYEDSLTDIKKSLVDTGPFSVGYSIWPIIHRKWLSWILNKLQESDVETAEFEQKVSKIDEEFENYKRVNRDRYKNALKRDIDKIIDDYSPERILEDEIKFDRELHRRTYIEILLSCVGDEIEVDYSNSEIDRKDEDLKKLIQQAKEVGTYTPIQIPHAPKHYWWLHLEDQNMTNK